MKKTYVAPEAEEIRFLTQELMGPSFVVQPDDDTSYGGDGDTTQFVPLF